MAAGAKDGDSSLVLILQLETGAQEPSRQQRIEFGFVHGHDGWKDVNHASRTVLVDSDGAVSLFENPIAPVEQARLECKGAEVIFRYRRPCPIAEDFYSEGRRDRVKAGKRDQKADVFEPANQTPFLPVRNADGVKQDRGSEVRRIGRPRDP